LLSTLSESYEGLVVSLSEQTTLTLQTLVGLLLHEEVRSKSLGKASNSEKPRVLFTYKKRFKSFPKMKYESKEYKKIPKKVGKCFYCQKPSHHIRDCRKRIANEGRKQINNVIDSPSLFVASFSANIVESNKWYLDSGATQHMTPNCDGFSIILLFPQVKGYF